MNSNILNNLYNTNIHTNPQDYHLYQNNENQIDEFNNDFMFPIEKRKYDIIDIYSSNDNERNFPEIKEENTILYNNIYFNNTKASSKQEKFFDNKLTGDNELQNNLKNNIMNFPIKEEAAISNFLKLKKDLNPKKKKCGRKSKYINHSENQLKFANNNMIRKSKNLVLTYSLEYINEKIKNIYNGNIGEGINIKKLLDISQEQKADNTINSIRLFFNKTLKEIFSVNISSKFTQYLSNHNKILISKLLNEKDEDKKNQFIKLFNYTFSDCLNKFIGNGKDNELEGFPNFDDIRASLNEEETYLDKIKQFLADFEDIIKSKKPRVNRNGNKSKGGSGDFFATK